MRYTDDKSVLAAALTSQGNGRSGGKTSFFFFLYISPRRSIKKPSISISIHLSGSCLTAAECPGYVLIAPTKLLCFVTSVLISSGSASDYHLIKLYIFVFF